MDLESGTLCREGLIIAVDLLLLTYYLLGPLFTRVFVRAVIATGGIP